MRPPSRDAAAAVLIEVSYGNDNEVAQVLRQMTVHNWYNPKEVIQVIYEPFLVRLAARIKLQRWYRGIVERRRQKPIFQMNVR